MKDIQFPVLNFLQYRIELKKIPRTDLAFNTWQIILKHGFDNPEDFYSQPFSFELAEKLFKGITYEVEERGVRWSINNRKEYALKYFYPYFPNLDEFITKFASELQWKEV